MVYVCGHKIPDSDSIVGAISIANLLNKRGIEAKAVRQGDLNIESKFILEKFGFDDIEYKTSFKNEELFIVDYSDLAQAPDDIKDAKIIGIVDHHKLGDITTSSPLEMWVRPVGCSNTIIYDIYKYYDIEISKEIASIMLCAILSDTVIFKSPTCTPYDKEVANNLAKIASIDDLESLGMEMFKVKSNLNEPIRKLIKRDFKYFDMNGNKVGIGQLEVVDLSLFDDKKEALIEDMKKLKDEEEANTIMLMLTDIIKEGSEILVVSDSIDVVEKAFNVEVENNSFYLPRCLSRKKQIIPYLQPAFDV